MKRSASADVYGATRTPLVASSTMWLESTADGQTDDGTNPLAPRVRALRDLARRMADEAAAPVGVAIAYYVSCLVGFALRYPSSGISFFWPPNAVLLTALLIVAPRRWPALIAGAFVAHGVAHAEDGIRTLAWSVQYFGNASQALLAAVIMRRYGAVAIHEDSRQSLIFIIGACVVAPAIASLTPAYIYVSLGWANDVFAAWRARTVSNAMATLVLVPSLLALWRYRVQRPALHAWRVVEFVALFVGLAAPHAIASAVSRSGLLGLSVALAATTPFLIWAAVRFGGVGLSFALTAALLMMSQTATQMGGVGGGLPSDTIVGVQLLFTGIAVPLSLLAGLLQQQRTAHRALVDVEHQNRAILRALPDTTVLHTKQGAILQSYPGRVDDAVKTRPVVDAISPDVVSMVVTTPLTADGEEPQVHEYSDGPDDAARRYEARSVAVDRERTVTIIRDITERWRSQQALLEAQSRYTLALGAGGIGVWQYDVAQRRFHVDGTLKTILGYADEEISGAFADWQAVVFEPDRDDLTERLSALVTGAAGSFEAEFRVVHKDGSSRWIVSRGSATDINDGKPARVIGTYAHITERKEAERALTEAHDRLARLGRIEAMSELTASVAHELSQPLAVISTNVLACLRGLDSERHRDLSAALKDVLEETWRASKIIERTQRLFGNRSPQPISLNLNTVVREVVRIASPRLRELHVRLQEALDPAIPNVYADDVQMQQVLFNLVLNAAEALRGVDTNRRVVRVSTRHTRRHVIVSVRDTGIGLDQADATRIFEPFYTTKETGTGVGLAISRSIVQSHGGTLWGVSNSDYGSTFRFKIPLDTSDATPAPHQTPRVLVVDDDRGMRTALKRLLNGSGYDVAVATNGARALALTETFRPDAEVIDVSLGDMSGLDLVKRLRSLHADRSLFLIAITAYEDDHLRRACLAAGFDAYLVKQTQIAELPVLLEQRAAHRNPSL